MLRFKKGDTVWAKMRGFPYWPGVVVDSLDKMEVRNSAAVCVYFFGSKNYGFLKMQNLKDYKSHRNKLKKSYKRKSFQVAVKEIEDFIEQNDSTLNENDSFYELMRGSSNPQSLTRSNSFQRPQKRKSTSHERSKRILVKKKRNLIPIPHSK